jgi:hypothetical protein
MKMNCTIYANTPNPEHLINVITAIVDINTLSMELDGDNWAAIQHHSESVDVLIRRLNRATASEQFSDLIVTTYRYIEQINSTSIENKSQLLEKISSSTLILSIVAEPEFTETAEDIVFELAKAATGIVFTGDAFFNHLGGLILDVEGTSEESINPN